MQKRLLDPSIAMVEEREQILDKEKIELLEKQKEQKPFIYVLNNQLDSQIVVLNKIRHQNDGYQQKKLLK